MKFGICILNAISLRSESCDQSEMVTQLLFGETYKVVRNEKEWVKIKIDFDDSEGWISRSQFEEISLELRDHIASNETVLSNELVTYVSKEDLLMPITLGGCLPGVDNNTFQINQFKFTYEGDIRKGKFPKADIVRTAYLYLNAPFLWGGKTPFGIDSSGFTQMVYKLNGYTLCRKPEDQANQGEVMSFIEESQPGDLAFFDDKEGNINHAGIILNDNHIIHCYGKVRIDRLDQSGIYNVDLQKHTHKLRVIKQIF